MERTYYSLRLIFGVWNLPNTKLSGFVGGCYGCLPGQFATKFFFFSSAGDLSLDRSVNLAVCGFERVGR